jgi:nucleoredoxin
MDLIKSQTFVRADGSTLEAEAALSNKELILVYFSANWCPPSKSFTPILKEFYDVVAKEGVEIINVSWDQSSEEMLNYMKESHGDWLALKHDCDDSKDMCTYNMTRERMVPQKLYKCATCGMADDGYCICEFCIKSCHEGHEISMFDEKGVGYGFCDCGEEASQDKRSCNLLKSTKEIFPDSIREKLEKKFEVEDLPSVVVMKADGTLVSEDAATDIANSRGEAPWGEELNLVKEWKEYDEKANSFCEIIKGSSLVKADKSTKPVDEALAGKDIVLVYFSAHWCPPCRRFTPLLKNFYQDVSEKGVELIFVSSDSSKEDMLNYMKESHGDWYAFEHESKIGQKLSKTFRISGIPTLVALKTDGTIIDRNARGSIEKGASIISEWKSV